MISIKVLLSLVLSSTWNTSCSGDQAFKPGSVVQLRNAVTSLLEQSPTGGCKSVQMDLHWIDGGQTNGLAGVTTKKSGWIMKQKMWSLSGSDYTIVDESRKPAFTVVGKVLSLHGGMLFLDPAGEPLAYLQKKLLDWRPTWKLYTFAPNFEGQEPSGKTKISGPKHFKGISIKVAVPYYKYAIIEDQPSSLFGKVRFRRYVSNDDNTGKVDVWDAKVQLSFKFNLDIRKAVTKEVVAKVGQTSFFQYEAASEYAIVAAKGLDRLGLIAFVVACEKIKEQKLRQQELKREIYSHRARPTFIHRT